MPQSVAETARALALELLEKTGLRAGQTVIVGCSTSEIAGQRIGTSSRSEIGAEVFGALNGVFKKHGVFLAAQCCEHLNRAVIIEREASEGLEIVNVLPIPSAGGAFAAAAYSGFADPVAAEEIKADAGLDIGGTLIGMHLKRVAVPLRLETDHIGKAAVLGARTRPKLIGGSRAQYDDRY